MDYIIADFVNNTQDMRNLLCDELFDVRALEYTCIGAVFNEETRKAGRNLDDFLFKTTINGYAIEMPLTAELTAFREHTDEIAKQACSAATTCDFESDVRVLGLPKTLADRYTRERIHADEILESTMRSVQHMKFTPCDSEDPQNPGERVPFRKDSRQTGTSFGGTLVGPLLSNVVYASLFTDAQRRVDDLRQIDPAYCETLNEARRTLQLFEKRTTKWAKRYTRREQRTELDSLRRRYRKLAGDVVRLTARQRSRTLSQCKLSTQLRRTLQYTHRDYSTQAGALSLSFLTKESECAPQNDWLDNQPTLPLQPTSNFVSRSELTAQVKVEQLGSTFGDPPQMSTAPPHVETAPTEDIKPVIDVEAINASQSKLSLPPKKKRFESGYL